VTRWLAGTFDPRARAGAARLPGALAPYAATVLERPPLWVAYSGPVARPTSPVCLLDGHLDNAHELAGELNGRGGGAAHGSPAARVAGGGAAVSADTCAAGGATATPDTRATEELVAAAYRRWGRALLPRLRGDFVLLLWDEEQGEGLIARDQLGVRPLFLHHADGCVRFASEMRHLLACLLRRPAVDPAGVAHWIALSNRPGLQTLYTGVSRLQPGGALLLDRGGVRVERYWEPRFEEPLELPQEQLIARTRTALRAAVSRRIGGQGLTGVLMSGGLDSSSVAALCAEQAREQVYACSATFPEHPAVDEGELIGTLTRELDLRAIGAQVRPGGLLASVLESLAAWEMPLLGWGDFWTLPLMRAAAARGVHTMLDGDGGDQLFGVRTYLLADRLRHGHPLGALALAYELPGAEDRPPRRAVASVLRHYALAGALPYGLHRTLAPLARGRTPAWLLPRTARALLDSDVGLAWKRLDGPRWWAREAHVLTCGIEEVGVFEHQRRRAALADVEARHPLLDLDLVLLGLRHPPRATFDRRFNRPLLRASMAGLLPDAVRLRPEKARFETLIADCLTGPDGTAVRRLLTGPGLELGAYLDPEALRSALFEGDPQARRGSFGWMWQVWRLLTAECWLRAQAHGGCDALRATLSASPARVALRPSPSAAREPSYVFPP
jgi:asparagine synthase (glutamine-hydrolysing)